MPNGRINGVIISLLPNRGFGFIRGDDSMTRFFHVDDVTNRRDFDLMHEGQQVSFVPVDMGEKNPAMQKGNGLRASSVEPLQS